MTPRISRRTLLAGTAAAAGGYAFLQSPVARAYTMSRRQLRAAGVGGDGRLRVYLIALDGLRPDEVTPTLMPNLTALREESAVYASGEAHMIAETLPNHVSMVTGVSGARNGVPANEIWDRQLGAKRYVDRPADVTAPTLFHTLGAAGLTTGSVMSKRYLYTVFEGMADHHWDPQPEVPVSGHAPDTFTTEALLSMVDDHDPDFVFVNLGDIDRSGHSDPTGAILDPAFRTTILLQTDELVGRFVTMLQDSGRWGASVVLFTADHSMDWSLPHRYISLDPVLAADPVTTGRYEIAQNGGADLVYFTGEPADRDTVVARMRELILEVEGVASVHAPAELGIDAKAGDVVALCEPGYRFSDTSPWSNPIPGNHGHAVTLPIPVMVTGGVDFIRRGTVIERVTAHNWDMAPTVAWLFGLPEARNPGALRRHYDGSVLVDAFTVAGGPPPGPGGRRPEEARDADAAPAPAPAPGGELPATGAPVAVGAGAAAGAGAMAVRAFLRRVWEHESEHGCSH